MSNSKFCLRLKKRLLVLNLILVSSINYAVSHGELAAWQNRSTEISHKSTQVDVSKGKIFNEIIAIVNDQAVTRHELNTEVMKMETQLQEQLGIKMAAIPDVFNQEALRKIINQTLILQVSERQNIQISDFKVNNTIHQISTQYGISINSLKQKLKTSGMNFKTYFDTIKKQLVINKLQQIAITGKIHIPPAKIDEYILRSITDKNTFYKMKNILLSLPKNADEAIQRKALERAKNIIQQIQFKKISFSDAAKKYSQSSNSTSGGKLEWKTLLELPKVYTYEIKKIKNGQISTPFIANNSVQIIKLIDTKVSTSAKHFICEYRVRKIAINTNPIVGDIQAKIKLVQIMKAFNSDRDLFGIFRKSDLQKKCYISPDHQDLEPGWVSLSQLPKKLAQNIRSTRLNEVSLPFKIGNQWQIIEVSDQRQKDGTKIYEQAQATQVLFQENAQKSLKTWISSLRDEAYIKILNSELELII